LAWFPAAQDLLRDGYIIERYHLACDRLRFFMSFAGQKHQIPRPRLGNGQFNRVMTIGLDDDRGGRSAETGEDLVDDGQRIFSSWIV
jgi:hypothetical protein